MDQQYLARRYPLPGPDPLAVPEPIFDRLQQGAPNPMRLLHDEDEILRGFAPSTSVFAITRRWHMW